MAPALESPADGDQGVILSIAAAILETLQANGGHLDRLGVPALKARFPGHEGEVDRQIGELSANPRKTLGHYQLVRRVGVGASGEVYEAIHGIHGRRVALKVLLRTGDAFRAQLEREARALAMLDHPNIARLHSFETDDGVGFLVMDFVAGCSLDRVLSRLRRQARQGSAAPGVSLLSMVRSMVGSGQTDQVPGRDQVDGGASASSLIGGPYLREVAAALAGAAGALAFAHGQRIVHRDVKPGNLLIDTDGHIRLTDFGLAQGGDLLRLSRTGIFVGTPYYASPEQVAARGRVGSASDIWSLGATLYELVTLTVPFSGASEEEVFEKILKGNYRRPREVNPRVPIELERVIGRCLEVDPELRYAGAQELAADLSRFAAGEAVRARPVGVISRLVSQLRHPTRRTSLVAMLVVALGLAVAGSTIIPSIEASQRVASQRKERLRAAERDLRDGIENSDPEALDRAIAAAGDALALDPDDVVAQQAVLVTAGRVAYEHTDDERAASYLAQARALGPLSRDAEITLGRAALAANHLDVARRAFEAVLASRPDVRIAQDLGVAVAFEHTRDLVPPVTKCLPLIGVAGLPAGTVLALCFADGAFGELRCFPQGLDHPSRLWMVDPARPAGGAGDVFIERGEGAEPRVFVIGSDCLFRSVGPITVDGPERWQRLDDPTLIACGDDALSDGIPAGVHLHGAVLPGPSRGGRPVLAVSRMRAIATATLDENGVSNARAVPWAATCDITVLDRVELSDGPALLVGLGAWEGWSIVLARASNNGQLDQIGTALVGVPAGAGLVRAGPAGDYIAVSNAAYRLARSPETFGRASEAGWEYGIQILRLDASRKAFQPVAFLGVPRPTNARGALRVEDVFHSDPGPEILLSERVKDVATDAMTLCRTHVVSLTGTTGESVGSRLRLPGSVVTTVVEPNGALAVVLEDVEGKQRVVRLPR